MLRLLIAMCLCAGALAAQDNHYWTHQFGTRASLMGGAMIGGVDDTSAVYYNPGRLGWITNDSLKVSANGYQGLLSQCIAHRQPDSQLDGSGADQHRGSITGLRSVDPCSRCRVDPPVSGPAGHSNLSDG